MTRRSLATAFLVTLLLLLTSCGGSPSTSTAARDQQKISRADLIFANQATARDIATIAFGRLAETKTTDSAIRDLAVKIAQNRTSVNNQLAAVAQNEGLSLPAAMDAEHQQQFVQLQSLNGPAFNRAWLDGQLQNQTMTIQAFQAEADGGSYAPFRDLAAQTLPGLLEDLRATQQLSLAR